MSDKVRFIQCTQEDIKKMNEQETKEKEKDEI